jgi:tetratricopeptide (TPR) repeat protein
MSDSPQIVTFYSYKGGVGRSMAVLNVAYAMANRGLNVLVLDLDLEAPGLSGFLYRNRELDRVETNDKYDMVDLLRWASEVASSSEPVDPSALPPASDYVSSVPLEKFCRDPVLVGVGRLDFIPVDEARDYYGRMTALGIGNLDREALIRIGSVLRSWLKSREFTEPVPDYYGMPETKAHYDFILVDSRTGVTEIGGLCIGPLSDNLVVLTALNDQNIHGTKQFLDEVGVLATGGTAERRDPKPTLIVASPVPAGEIETKKKRLESLRKVVGKIDVKLSYHPQLALFETIFVRDYQDEYLAREYFQLLELVIGFGNDGSSLTEFLKSLSGSPDEGRGQLHRFLRNVSLSPNDMQIFEAIREQVKICSDVDFALLDRAYRICWQSGSGYASHWGLKRTGLVSDWAQKTDEPELRSLRFKAVETACLKVLQSTASTSEQRIASLNTWGVALSEQAKQKTGAEADSLFALAGEKFEAALRIKPDKRESLNNWGNALLEQAKQKTGAEADQLFALAGEKFEAALRINPDDHETLNNWGNALLEQAKQRIGADADQLLALAVKKLLIAEELGPGSGSYNLACIASLQGDADECRKWLLNSFEHGELPTKQHLLDDSDLESVRSLDWFQDLLAKLP